MKKRLSALILAMLMILSICPVAMAEDAAVSTASAYDVHIKGNFIGGETLTAHYTYYNSAEKAEDTTKTVYTWYYKEISNNIFTVTQFEQKTGDNTCVIPTNICETGKWGSLKDIYVSVSTADADGNGEPVLSGHYAFPVPDSDTTATVHSNYWAINAHLVPKNPEGSIEVGDTLVARYSYQKRDKATEGDTTFTWYRKDTPDGTATVIQATSTNNEYTLTAADFGKWIECTVTPYDVNGKKGTASTAKIHYGNLGMLENTTATVKLFNEVTVDSTSGLKYPTSKILSDGNALMNRSVSHGSYISSGSWGADGYIEYNLGETTQVDGVFLHMSSIAAAKNYASTISEYKIQYSENGEDYYDLHSDAATVNVVYTEGTTTVDENNSTHSWSGGIIEEVSFNETINAHYIRFQADRTYGVRIEDFYPFKKQDAQVSVNDESIATLEDGVITVKKYNESSENLLAAITATSAIDGEALAPIFVDAEGNTIAAPFNITEETTEKLKVTGKNGVALEYALAFNKVQENLTLNCNEEFVSLSDGKLKAAWKTPSSVLLTAVTATSAVDGSTLTPSIVDAEGNAILEAFEIDENTTGKYVRFTNIYGDTYDYEIMYSVVGSAYDTSVDVGTTKGEKTEKTVDIPVDWSTPAVWHISVKVFAVPNQTVSLTIQTGNNWDTSMYLQNMLKFNADNTLTVAGAASGSSFKWVSGMWHDIDMLVNTNSIDPSKINCPVDIKVWVDGVSIPMNASQTRLYSQALFTGGNRLKLFITGTGDGTQTTYGIPQAKEVFIRKVYDTSVFAPVNDAALNLKSNGEVVKDIEQGQSYEFENTMGVYKGNSFDNYLAVFDVTYQDGVEVFRVLNRAVKNPTKIEINEGQEVRAFCFSDTLVPLVKMGEWK